MHTRKTFVISHNPELILDLLGHLLAMALHDGIFTAEFRRLEDIYWHQIPSHREGIQLKIKRMALDRPVFRQPTRGSDGYRTSEHEPLKSDKWSDYLRKLGEVAGLKCNLTQYVWRRSLINAINSMSSGPAV